MAYALVYHPDVETNRDVGKRIQRAIETRLATDPERYAETLARTLKGYWKLRVGDYRVVFKIVNNEIWIFGIMHRRDVYQRVEKRLPID